MSDIRASIVDQQVKGVLQRRRAQLAGATGVKVDAEDRLISTAFVVLTVKTALGLSEDEAIDCLTEGSGDFGVDALHIGDARDGVVLITLFQAKYSRSLNATSCFPQTAVEKSIQATRILFDPGKTVSLNKALTAKIEEVRSLILDGIIPRVRFILCNNGLKWTDEVQGLIDGESFGENARFEYFNHDNILSILDSVNSVDDRLELTGAAHVEDFDFRRVLIGKIDVTRIKDLFDRHGDRLLDRNIRRFLGMQGNRVNDDIARTLTEPTDRTNFYFYNNGITMVCRQFNYTGLQKLDWSVKIDGMQIINGGQTCKTIQRVLGQTGPLEPPAHVLIRVYELPKDDESLVSRITVATNNQTPVDLRDLKSNDPIQRRLDLSVKELGYVYHRHKAEVNAGIDDITSAVAAEAILSVWRRQPQQAKFRSSQHFGKLYDAIFTLDLNGAQAITAVLLFRIAENHRRRPAATAPDFVRYSSCFSAMLMGGYLLEDLSIPLGALDHRNFANAKAKIIESGETYFLRSVEAIGQALVKLYGNNEISLQRLSATFRRGDLLEFL